jgi:hypothetical protein
MSRKIDWRKHKAVVFESDDWGGCGVEESPDLRAYHRMTQIPVIRKALVLRGDGFWPWLSGTLETPDKMQRLFDFLLNFRGADGRPVVFTPVYLAANPDFEAIRENGFTEYVDIGICDGFPSRWDTSRWNHSEIIAKAKEGIRLGVWRPQTHGRAHHYSPKKWVRTLREKADEALCAFFELGMVGEPLHRDRLREVKGLEFDDMTDEELDEWFGRGLEYFRKAFGYETPCAPMTNAVWAKEYDPDLESRCEKMLARYGIKFNSHSYKRREYGMGRYDPGLDLTFMGWNANLDPLGSEEVFTHCYRQIQEAWAKGEPVIVGTHRINYVSLDPEQERQGYLQLEQLLSTLGKEHPDTVYLTSFEVGQLYRQGWSSVRYGDDIVCRNYSGAECEINALISDNESVDDVVNIPGGHSLRWCMEEHEVAFKAAEGDYLLCVKGACNP